MFSTDDLLQIKNKNIDPETALGQLRRFERGFPPLWISESATVGNGILKLSDLELKSLADKYEEAEVSVVKFVPASGAASRMFKNLFEILEKFDRSESIDEHLSQSSNALKFFEGIKDFAFYEELNQRMLDDNEFSVEDALVARKHAIILKTLLSKSGLNYGNLPKGLLTFHKYGDELRTAAEEHITEGILYAMKDHKINIHFTVSSEHRKLFEEHISKLIDKHLPINVEVSFSEQHPSTDTIAASSNFDPFRDGNGNLLFRPAGHGALLSNLNAIDSDIIFIKNVDNVVSDNSLQEGVQYKKVLAGVLLSFQEKAFELLMKSEQGESIETEGKKLLHEMGTTGDFSSEEIRSLLNRPIRVCGMVKNEGEPGGGPFWVQKESGESLQIVESAQVNKADPEQLSIFKSGTHFNPVDLVCGTKDYKGKKFDLIKYRDEETGFITEKSYNGEKLLAMELPGLWNGSMADWNTIFVEVPLATFNPVKTVTDLLKPAHR